MQQPDTTGDDDQRYQEYNDPDGNFLGQYNKICERHNKGFNDYLSHHSAGV